MLIYLLSHPNICKGYVTYWKGYVVKHNYVKLRCFNDYTRQLHVSAPTGHLQVVFKRTYGPIMCVQVMKRSLHLGFIA